MAPKSATKSKAKPSSRKSWKSRAVTRLIEPGSAVECMHCGDRVKFQARLRLQQVICNIYTKGRWDHVEHFHAECYDEADQPFGEPED